MHPRYDEPWDALAVASAGGIMAHPAPGNGDVCQHAKPVQSREKVSSSMFKNNNKFLLNVPWPIKYQPS